MPLKGTEKELGKKMSAAAKSTNGDGEIAWEKVAEVAVQHFTSNAVVTGKAPSGGGPIVEGKIE